MNTWKRMSHDQGAERQSLCTRNKTPALRCEGWIGRWVGYTVNRLSGQRSGVRAAPSAVIFPIQLKPEGVDTGLLFVANRSRWYPNLKSLVNFWHLGIGGGTGGGGTGAPGPLECDILTLTLGVAWKEWCQKSVVPLWSEPFRRYCLWAS